MWISADGRVNVRMLPTENVPGGEILVSEIRRLNTAALDDLDQRLMDISWLIADATDVFVPTEMETGFEASTPPTELLSALDWTALIGEGAACEFEEIELRWRLDVLAIIQQVIADEAAAGEELHPPR